MRDGMAEFDPSQFLHDDDPDGAKRRAKRDSLFLLTTVSDEAGQSLGRARVRNLSETGLMADCERGFADGDRLVVDLRGVGQVAGTVCWVRGDRIGLVFDQQIDPQAARRPVGQTGSQEMPNYLRPVPRIPRFGR